jgi:hypothetical protein
MDRIDDPTPRFICLSDCGRYYATWTPHIGKQAEDKVDIAILELSTPNPLCTLVDQAKFRTFRVSSDRSFLALGRTETHIFDLRSGEVVPWYKVNAEDEFVFSPDGKSALIKAGSEITLVDLRTREAIAVLNRRWDRTMKCFFDPSGRPKFYYYEPPRLEQWDVLTDNCDWQRELPTGASFSTLGEKDRTVFISQGPEASNVTCWSLADGRLLARVGTHDVCEDMQLSSNGRFFAYAYRKPPLMQHLLDGLRGSNSNTQGEQLPPSFSRIVVDTETGRNWPQIPARQGAMANEGLSRFRDDGSCLITMNDNGIYEWDLPPRWPYSPWAWAALGAWLSLGAIWWRLRKRRSGQAALA